MTNVPITTFAVNAPFDAETGAEDCFSGIVGKSNALQNVLQKVAIVAPTDATVLLLGETGTGKELIARAIHRLSPRYKHAFVPLNCATVPAGLVESEMFGHERGAFTGALIQKRGKNSRTTEPSFWTRSATSALNSNRSCFVPCKNTNSSASAAFEASRLMFA